MSDLQPRQFGKYQVKEFLGQGAMADVYRAFHPMLERDVAIKVIHSHLAQDPDFVERFRSEAKTIAALRHPGIVQVYDFEVRDDALFMVMEYVPGETLSQFLAAIHREGNRLTLPRVLNLFQPILQAVAYAHHQGIVHRDLKPANVLLNPQGHPILADFGLSKIIKAEQLAESDVIIGTPAYMSPEQGSGQPGDERSDIYSLGIMLYEMTTGIPPFCDGSPISIILKHLDEPLPPPRAIQGNLPPRLEQIIQTALQKNPTNRFQSAQEFLEQLNAVAISPISSPMPLPAPIECPYRGLQNFEEEHARYYFGREVLVDQLLQLLAPISHQPPNVSTPSARFLAIVGASGSGKSSLARAGLIPAIRNQALPGSGQWVIQVIKPGHHPLEALAAGLSAALNHQDFQAQRFAYGRALHQIWSNALPQRYLLLVVDQFEEIFTLCHAEAERQLFIENLLYATAVTPGRVIVVITMRADFYHRCATYRDVATRISARQVLVGRMEESELRRAIEQPAQKVGLKFEASLVNTILEDVAGQPGALPLLQHALLELWERREGPLLTLSGYRASGGVAGAIAQRAETIYRGFSPPEQALARRIMLRLTQPGEGTEDTRRRAKKQELLTGSDNQTIEMTETVLQKLVNARLITVGHDSNAGEEMIDVAHEALIRGWTRLRNWIDEDRAALLTHRQLAQAAEAWQQNNHDESFLYRGARLAQATEWAEIYADELSELEQKFLNASQSAAQLLEQEKEAARRRELAQAQALADAEHQRAEIQARASNRLRWLVVGLALIFLAAVGAAILARRQEQKAEQQAGLALSRQLAAQAIFLTDKQPDLALLLSLEANTRSPNPTDRNKLLLNLEFNPNLMAILHGDSDGILSIAYSPAGKIVAAGDRNSNIVLWDTTTYQPLAPPLSGHSFNVWSLAFNPNGQILASGSGDHTIILWDMDTRQPIDSPLSGHTDEVHAVVFSPDGKILASGSNDTTIILWDVATRQPVGPPLAQHEDVITALAFSPDGKTLASGSNDNTIILWDVVTGQQLGLPLAHHENAVTALAFSPDTLEGTSGKTLASGNANGTITLWNIAPRQSRALLIGHTGLVTSLAFTPDGQMLASGSEDKTIILWDVATGQQLGLPLAASERVSSLAFSPTSAKGQTLVSALDSDTLLLWDMTAYQFLLGHQEWVDTVAFSPDGKLLASGSDDDTIILWDVATRRPTGPPLTGHTGDVLSVAFSPDNKILASAGSDQVIRLWDVASGQPIREPLTGHTDWISSIAFSPVDGQLLASAGADKTIRLWDVAAGQQLGSPLTGHSQAVLSIAFSPDGKTLASGSIDHTVRLWDISTALNAGVAAGRPVGEPLTGHTDWVWDVEFSPDGQMLASASNDGAVRLWDISTALNTGVAAGRPLGRPLTGHTDQVWGLSFHPNGRILASSSRDNTIILWDIITQEPIDPPLIGHKDWVWGLDFSPATPESAGGQILASGSRDASIILWQIQLEDWPTRACRMANRNLTPSEWAEFIGPDIPYQNTCPNLAPK
jgi:WD40 repeat protein/serine/threonine protein kinase